MSQSLWKESGRRLDDGKDDRMKLEKKVVGLVATILLVLSVAVCGIFLGIPDLHVWAQQKQLQYATQVEKGESVLSLMQGGDRRFKRGAAGHRDAGTVACGDPGGSKDRRC